LLSKLGKNQPHPKKKKKKNFYGDYLK